MYVIKYLGGRKSVRRWALMRLIIYKTRHVNNENNVYRCNAIFIMF